MSVPVEVENLVRWLPDDFAVVDRNVGRCIEAARICVPALRRAGVACRAVACDLTVFNETAWEHYQRGLGLPDWPPEAWSVGCSCDDRTERVSVTDGSRSRFNGHVIIVGGDPHSWLADITFEQFHRPEKGIVAPGPLLIDFPAGSDYLPFEITNADGLTTRALYRLRPEVSSWRLTPAWRQDLGNPELDLLASAARGELTDRVENIGPLERSLR